MITENTTTNAARDAGQSIYRQARAILRICPDIDLRRAQDRSRGGVAAGDLYTMAWDQVEHSEREELAEAGLAPGCECPSCGCDEPATTTDDGANRVCAACEEYTTDDDGETLCSRCEGVETVVESCGAGNQTRSYLRKSPPAMPDADPDGEYAIYWETSGDDAHVCSRHSSYDEAKQAVEAKDWPRPGDNTHYLCGYGIRKLVGGEWVGVDETGAEYQEQD